MNRALLLSLVLLGLGFVAFLRLRDGMSEEDRKWQAKLTPLQFEVTRRKGTERAYSGKYWSSKSEGTYSCICCEQPLFDSSSKYDSGTGWPSFSNSIDDYCVVNETDFSGFMIRKEVKCSECDAHLGHVFKDGPQPTGLRFCINSAALDFQASVNQADHPSATQLSAPGNQSQESQLEPNLKDQR